MSARSLFRVKKTNLPQSEKESGVLNRVYDLRSQSPLPLLPMADALAFGDHKGPDRGDPVFKYLAGGSI
jgi:hypothetical protein